MATPSTIKMFSKNKIDLDNDNVTITVTDSIATDNGQSIVDFTRNRKNSSAWVTTGSTDAANTQIDVDMADTETFDRIILVGHNFKAFTIQYFDGVSYQDFSTSINETVNTDDTTYFSFDSVVSSAIRIIITGTQTADADKRLKQLLIVAEQHTFTAYPKIKNPDHNINSSSAEMLSGKFSSIRSIGNFTVDLDLGYWNNDADLTFLESLYFDRLPLLLWLCGGDEDQFRFKRVGYRLEDFFLVRAFNAYSPEWVNGIYTSGINHTVKLREVVN